MKAYLIVTLTVHDEPMFAEYRSQVGDTAAPFGGQFLAAGGKATVLEGQWEHPGTVVVEFPSRESAERWYHSAAYQKIIDLRLKSTRGSLAILDGV
ncbi:MULTISPECIES: DUF1330 domain-containing protein [unclassified Bradyrhizobium]|uniref:DUF1330 domain-containing protein n=1 Tax=unclassified Bradyrhizobium TaxID=2631580 RepID=UPI001BA89CF3|nr:MULTISPECIES: DUF1330 domain-containing protein [unclassified Bradyrhizobium]MBR1203292.1 DUF1330 domain-containing protein [Bradyrhizobium sp. AUGA SZCCT0124]MBR1312955.1 DUF1330 domain-containing protein [Bradyrhizobium sp. AUGA SZCCT0051]MBR1341313.1 DUF1330 domain-containing protein [Bradyrhizobium sp. AUGA SZCCT0105]MBR1356749.1 DUF1330 domain-containing protein [Bradyrhizobium sp. AUGA SZCCT0045]